ncbi:T9SS type A sorting domain-containing protein [uncultured Aquimarina sp.]|uniref:T9SS type A sorting domain-containing protein n=1 Tax=uncultured Aquimarina sp. TaxID=575652 RepID=UPI002618EFAE|nr:T9SS type A sorting domain-containing protein [uncultured Aquimarina sp.]
MKTIYTLLLLCIASAIQAQSIDTSVISNSGDINSNASHIINFTIGESFIGSITNTQSIDQGFWSGVSSLNELSTEEFTDGNSIVTIYPNPASDFFTIRIPDIHNYTVSLYNLSGQLVFSQKVNATLLGNQIDISSLSQGVYILNLSVPETNEKKTFKIIKK